MTSLPADPDSFKPLLSNFEFTRKKNIFLAAKIKHAKMLCKWSEIQFCGLFIEFAKSLLSVTNCINYLEPHYLHFERKLSRGTININSLLSVIDTLQVPIVILKTKDMRNSTNIFLINLSVADLLVLLICTPTALGNFLLERFSISLSDNLICSRGEHRT